MTKRTKFIGETILLNFDGTIRRGTIIDIEFENPSGPVFLLTSPLGNQFWLTRREIEEHEVRNRAGK